MAAAGLAVTAAPLIAVSAEDSSKSRPERKGIDFGFSLYGMRALKLADALKVCAMVDFDSVELVAVEGWPCDPSQLSSPARDELRKQIDDFGLGVSAVMEDLVAVVDADRHRLNLDRLKRAAELGRSVSPKRPPVVETVLGGRPDQWEQLKGPMAKALHDWANVGEAAETAIAVKAHVGGALHTPADAKWLVDQVGSEWLRLVYDFSHFQLAGFELDESLKLLVGDTAYIHVKDTAGTRDDFQFLLPGDGKIDYRRYFELLGKSGYTGSVTVEVSGQIHGKPGYDPVATARRCYANLAPILAEAGIRRGAR